MVFSWFLANIRTARHSCTHSGVREAAQLPRCGAPAEAPGTGSGAACREDESLNPPREPNPQAEASRARLSSLGAAILRIGASPDIPAVLHELVESARALTGARCALVATLDEDGRAQDVAASGFPADEAPAAAGRLDDAQPLLKRLRARDEPLRLPELPDEVRSLGLPSDPVPCRAFLSAPMRHRGEPAGIVFLAGKAGGDAFTGENEELLALFSAQAAAAIASAREYRNEQRARAGLEVVVKTSPVGVVVFDAKTAAVVLINREARHRLFPLQGEDGIDARRLAGRLEAEEDADRRGDPEAGDDGQL